MKFCFHYEELIKQVQSDNEVIASWATFHTLKYYPESLNKDIHFFLDSPFPIIQEAVIIKLIKTYSGKYTNTIYKIFKDAEGSLKNLSGFYLSMKPNDLSKKIISNWFEENFTSQNYSYESLYLSTLSFVESNPRQNIDILFDRLHEIESDVIKNEVLFKILLTKTTSKKQYTQFLNFYFFIRQKYPAPFTIDKIIEILNAEEMTRDILAIKNKNYTLNVLYQEIYNSLSLNSEGIFSDYHEKKLKSLFHFSDSIHHLNQVQYDQLISFFYSWLKDTEVQDKTIISKKTLWTIEYFYKNRSKFLESIPKIRQKELAFIFSSKGISEADLQIQNWLLNSDSTKDKIKNYLQSPFISSSNYNKLIEKYFVEKPVWDDKKLVIQGKEISKISDHKNKIIFDFIDGKYKGKNVLWYDYLNGHDIENILYLNSLLSQIYLVNFNKLIKNEVYHSIQYSLKLFLIQYSPEAVALIKKNFKYLYVNHQGILFQFVHLYPERGFYTILFRHYKDGERNTARLLYFLASLHGFELENHISNELDNSRDLSCSQFAVQFKCQSCHHHDNYFIQKVYINVDNVYSTQKLTNDDIWILEEENCPQCFEQMNFQFEEHEMEQLQADCMVLLKTQVHQYINENKFNSLLYFVSFPKIGAQSFHPDLFIKKLEELKNYSNFKEYNSLRLQLSHFYEHLNLWEKNIMLLLQNIPEDQRIQFYTKIGLSWKNLADLTTGEKYLRTALEIGDKSIPKFEEIKYLKIAEKILNEINNPLKRRASFKLVQ